MNEKDTTPRLDAIVMTPAIASRIFRWSGGGRHGDRRVLAALISTWLDDEVSCEINGQMDDWVRVKLHGAKNISKADEIIRFVLEMANDEGEPMFTRVQIDIIEFRDTAYDEMLNACDNRAAKGRPPL